MHNYFLAEQLLSLFQVPLLGYCICANDGRYGIIILWYHIRLVCEIRDETFIVDKEIYDKTQLIQVYKKILALIDT